MVKYLRSKITNRRRSITKKKRRNNRRRIITKKSRRNNRRKIITKKNRRSITLLKKKSRRSNRRKIYRKKLKGGMEAAGAAGVPAEEAEAREGGVPAEEAEAMKHCSCLPESEKCGCRLMPSERFQGWMSNFEIKEGWIGIEFMVPAGPKRKAGTEFKIQYFVVDRSEFNTVPFQLEKDRSQYDIYFLVVDTTQNKIIASACQGNKEHEFSGNAMAVERHKFEEQLQRFYN